MSFRSTFLTSDPPVRFEKSNWPTWSTVLQIGSTRYLFRATVNSFKSTRCNLGPLTQPQVHQSTFKSPTDLDGLSFYNLDPPNTYSDLPPMVLGPQDVLQVYFLNLRSTSPLEKSNWPTRSTVLQIGATRYLFRSVINCFRSTGCNLGLLIRPQVHQSSLKSSTDICDLPFYVSDPRDTNSDLPLMGLVPLDVIQVYYVDLRSTSPLLKIQLTYMVYRFTNRIHQIPIQIDR